MTCPPELSDILMRIITISLLRMRALGWSGQPDLCALEADHIHKLPSLLTDYSPTRLAPYWNVERPYYCSRAKESDVTRWAPLWVELAAQLEADLTRKDSETP